MLCHDVMGGSGTIGSGCTFNGTVTVSDGRFTATGYPLQSGLCHSISRVEISSAQLDYQFFFGASLPAVARHKGEGKPRLPVVTGVDAEITLHQP